MVYAPLSLLFLPSIYVSLTDSPLRSTVLKASTAGALAIGLASVAVDWGVPLIIAPPMTLLAQSAGLIFQRGGK